MLSKYDILSQYDKALAFSATLTFSQQQEKKLLEQMFGLKTFFYDFEEALISPKYFLETLFFLIWFYCKKLRKFILAVKLPTHAHIGKGTRNNVEATFYTS